MAALRSYLVQTLRAQRREAQRGVVADFSPNRFDEGSRFVRIGSSRDRTSKAFGSRSVARLTSLSQLSIPSASPTEIWSGTTG